MVVKFSVYLNRRVFVMQGFNSTTKNKKKKKKRKKKQFAYYLEFIEQETKTKTICHFYFIEMQEQIFYLKKKINSKINISFNFIQPSKCQDTTPLNL